MAEEARKQKRLRQERRDEAINKYKDVLKKLRNANTSDDPEALQNFVSENLATLNDLYPVVKKKLDGNSADSKALRQLLSICVTAANRINRTSQAFDTRQILRRIRREIEDERGKKIKRIEFCRYLVDEHVKTFLCNPPTLEYMYGALRDEDLAPKIKRQRLREKIVESKTVTAKQKNIELDVEEDTTPKEVERICTRLSEITRNKPRGVSFFKTMVDPKSFTQTVENIFHVSFLVKEGKIGLKKSEDGGPTLYFDSTSSSAKDGPNKESILSFSMDDYRKWIEEFDKTPHDD